LKYSYLKNGINKQAVADEKTGYAKS